MKYIYFIILNIMYDFVSLTPLWIRFRYREELGDKWEVFDIIFSDTIDILRKENDQLKKVSINYFWEHNAIVIVTKILQSRYSKDWDLVNLF